MLALFEVFNVEDCEWGPAAGAQATLQQSSNDLTSHTAKL